MFDNTSIKGSFVSIALKNDPVQNYIELKPPVGTKNNAKLLDFIVVLDCSGSMTGKRIRVANMILNKLFGSSNVNTISIIRFGSVSKKPVVYDKKSSPLKEQKADLGGTDFTHPCRELISALKKLSNKSETMVLFISDGQGCPPTDQYAELSAILKEKNIGLQSVAISYSADAEVMIRLANMNGDYSMIFLQDDMTDEECVNKFYNELGAVGLVDELNVIFLDKKTNNVLKNETLKYKRGEEIVSLISPLNKTITEMEVIATLEDKKYQVQLEDVNLSDDYSYKAGFLCSYIINQSKKVIGQFVMKEINNQTATKLISNLKTLYTSNFDEKSIIDKTLDKYKSNGVLTSEGKSKIRELKKDMKSINMATLQMLNQHLSIVEDNNLGLALEAYSGQKINSKFNRRLLEIASKNKEKQERLVRKKDVDHLLKNKKPLPECIIWKCNPFEIADENFDELEQKEWVGYAALVDPGKIAAMSPWNMKNVFLRPIKITNTSVDFIRTDDNEKRKAYLNGYDVDFNTSIPLIDPVENEDAVRLALCFMRKSTEGNQEISRIITSTPDLYNPAMVNALYSTAVISTLKISKVTIDYEIAFRAYLTLLDISFYDSKTKSSTFFEKILKEVLADPSEFIARKDDDKLPNISRSMMFLNTINGGFSLEEGVANQLFFQLFLRACSDQTSQNYSLEQVIGADLQTYIQKINDLLSSVESHKVKDINPPNIDFGVLGNDVKLNFSKLFTIYGIHKVLRDFLKNENITLEDFYKKVLNGTIGFEKSALLLKEAQKYSRMKPVEFLKQIFNEEMDYPKVYQSILTICCYNHTDKQSPNHDSSHNKHVLTQCTTIGDIIANGEEAKNIYFSSYFIKCAKETKKLVKKRKKVINWIAKAREIRERYPLEKLRHVFEDHTLSYSGSHTEFPTRRDMFIFLDDFGFKDEDLAELEALTLSKFDNFKLSEWKRVHKYHLYGFYNYAPSVIKTVNSRDEFINKMRQALEKHYSGEIDPKFKREFTQRMQDYVPEFAGHFYEEYLINDYLESIKAQEGNLSKEEIKYRIYELCPNIHYLDQTRRRYREEHIEVLISEKLGAIE